MTGKLKRVIQDQISVEPEQAAVAPAGPAAPEGEPTKEQVIDEAAYQAWVSSLPDVDDDDELTLVGPTEQVDSFELYDALRRQNPHLPSQEFIMNPDLLIQIDSDGLATVALIVAVNLKLPLQ